MIDEAIRILEQDLLDSYDQPAVRAFIAYYKSTWVADDALFKKEFWNQFDEKRRTNNDVEGFHNLLHTAIGTKPNIFTALNGLKDVQADKENELNDFETTGEWNTKQKKKYKEINQQIEKYSEGLLQETMTIKRFLTKIQYLLPWGLNYFSYFLIYFGLYFRKNTGF